MGNCSICGAGNLNYWETYKSPVSKEHLVVSMRISHPAPLLQHPRLNPLYLSRMKQLSPPNSPSTQESDSEYEVSKLT